jgi:hypothetical protein
MGPDHLVFLPEDKFIHSRQACRADSSRFPQHSTLGVVVRLEAKLITVFGLKAQRARGCGEEFHSKSASNQR